MDINRLIQSNQRLIQLNQSNESVTPLMHILNIINSPIIISNPNNILNRSFEEQEIQKHPTEKNFIDSLEKIEFNEDQKEIYCGICLDNFKNDDKAYILPCKDQNHYFHVGENKESCGGILPWLQENNTCPVCRECFPEEKEINDDNSSEEDISDTDILDESIPIPNENFDEEFYDIDEENEDNEQEDNDDDTETISDDEYNLINEFLSGINNISENEEETTETEDEEEDPETMIENLLNQLMESNRNQNNVRIMPRVPLIQILNTVQQEMDEDYQLQQAIQRSITER